MFLARFETNKFMDKKSEMILLDIYFVPVVTYLIFSTGDYAGRVLSGIFQWVRIYVLICKALHYFYAKCFYQLFCHCSRKVIRGS